MNAPVRSLSPNQFHLETGHSLNNAAYHFRVLRDYGCIELIDEKPKRGSTEHVYQPVRQAMLWTREWEEMPPVARQAVAASVLRGFVENVGNAINAGAYDDGDPHDSWGSFYTDEAGEMAMLEILHNALADILALEGEVTERLKKNPKGEKSLVGFGMFGYRSAPRQAIVGA